MSASRDDILQELGLWPRWQRRDASGAGASPAAKAESADMVESPVANSLIQGVHDRGYLPHLKAAGGQYFVTFRLADSLPAGAIEQLEAIPEKQRSKKVQEHLDAGHGECWLDKTEVGELVRQTLLKFHGTRYHLHAWVIMPNHVHLLIEPVGEHALSDILQGIKSVSAHEANNLLGREGEFWQSESFDHLIRGDSDRERCVEYIAQNPVKAGLAKSAGEFRFSSAYSALAESTATDAGGAPAPRKPTPKVTSTITGSVTSPLSLDARAAEIAGMDWPSLKQCVADCTACPLHKGRHKTVFGVGDEAANWAQRGRNYKFFDAPVGLIFTVDKDLDSMSFIDIGIFLQTLMLAAKARGLDTCAQGAWNQYWSVTRRVLNVPEEDYIVCGLSLGYADPDAPVNSLVSEREPVEAFATFHGFEG